MWQRIALFSAAALVAVQSFPLRAEEPRPPSSPSLWAGSKWVRLEIIGGKIAVQTSRCGNCVAIVEPTEQCATRETLAIQAHPPAVLVHYEWDDGQRQIGLDIDDRGTLLLASGGQGTAALRYVQPAEGGVTLEIGGQKQPFSAATLWHLALVEPAACGEHLLPLLAELRPQWRLAEQAARLEQALISRAGTDMHAQRGQWQAWVDELAADGFAQRQAADQALRQAGQPVLAFLRQQRLAELNPEQRRRIRAILAEVADSSPDSPERVAGWLLDDRAVWLALLNRGELEQRVAAAEHLSKLCRRNLPFDPSASPESRQAQLVDLQAKLAEK
ncbi:MAG: hypothetical protein SFU86_07330 [Pirellulaceae bacterium]|nr:hypothetical protein [Pirellulaceae bacterium]